MRRHANVHHVLLTFINLNLYILVAASHYLTGLYLDSKHGLEDKTTEVIYCLDTAGGNKRQEKQQH